MRDLDTYSWIALILLIVGGFNWGIVGLFGGDLISGLFGHLIGRLIFMIVGVAAGYLSYYIYLQRVK